MVIVKLSVESDVDGVCVGLVVFGDNYGWIGL